MKKFIIYTDGGSRGNPGKAAIGIVFCNEKEQIIKKFGIYLGDNLTNNEAEYSAVRPDLAGRFLKPLKSR